MIAWISKRSPKPIVIGLTLFAFLLRAFRLDFQSYWIDESLTINYARMTLPELWHSLQTVRAVPPLYHLLTIYWVNIFGYGEYALRFFSLLFSVLAVPLIYRLGKSLGGARIGLIAALLLAVSPYQVWHGQDARNYSMLTAASVMSMWGFINLWRFGGWRWWWIYVLSTEWAIMNHYHGLIVIGVQGLFFLFTWRKNGKNYLRWGITLLIVLLPYILWMLFGSHLWQSDHWLPKVPLLESYLRSAIAYSVGELVPRPLSLWLAGPFALLFLIGLVVAARRPRLDWPGWHTVAFLLAFTLAPNVAAWAFSEWRTPVYLERYLIAVQIGYLLAVAFGLAGLMRLRMPPIARRLLAATVLAGLVAVNGWVLYQHYTNPAYAKSDWRGVIRTIEAFSLPGDAILMTGDGGENLFDFYYRGNLPVYTRFNTPVPPPDEAIKLLDGIAADHRRLWYTPYGVDIDPLLENRLAETAFPAWQSWIGTKVLALYHTGAPVLDRVETLNAPFSAAGTDLSLLRVALPAQPVAAGDTLPLQLTWQTAAPLPADYKLSVRLLNQTGDNFAQSDWPALAVSGPTSTWPVNQPVMDQRSLWLPADTPPGRYNLQLLVYNPANGQSVGEPVVIPTVTVAPAQIAPPPEALALPHRQSAPLGSLTLVGWAAPESVKPGQDLWLWLYWQAQTPVEPGTVFRLSLGNQNADFPLADALGPAETWQAGQVRRAVYHLPTSLRLEGDSAPLSVALISAAGDQIAQTPVTLIKLENRVRTFKTPAVKNPLNAPLGQPAQVTLLGYNLPKTVVAPGGSLALTLYWRAEAEMAVNYTVFVQALNSAGQVVAQTDLPPLGGAAPTTTWLPGEILTDPYAPALPASAAPGDYRLIVGMYDQATGQRLPVATGGDFVDLGIFSVAQ